MNVLSDMSTTEKNLWAELLVNLVVALYYFPKVFVLIRAGDEALVSPAMAGLVVKTVIVAIVVGIVVGVFLRVWREPGKEDERDYQFAARGVLIANRALVIFVLLIMGQLVFEALFPGIAKLRGIKTNPMIIAHLLMLSLMLSSTIKAVAQLFLYRRGY
jgi:Na+-driven multidrug efflux pump